MQVHSNLPSFGARSQQLTCQKTGYFSMQADIGCVQGSEEWPFNTMHFFTLLKCYKTTLSLCTEAENTTTHIGINFRQSS